MARFTHYIYICVTHTTCVRHREVRTRRRSGSNWPFQPKLGFEKLTVSKLRSIIWQMFLFNKKEACVEFKLPKMGSLHLELYPCCLKKKYKMWGSALNLSRLCEFLFITPLPFPLHIWFGIMIWRQKNNNRSPPPPCLHIWLGNWFKEDKQQYLSKFTDNFFYQDIYFDRSTNFDMSTNFDI